MSRRTLLTTLGFVAVCLFPDTSSAVFHLAVIDEVMTSYNGDPTAQFVEIRMLAPNQNFVGDAFGGGFHSFLAVFDTNGTFVGNALEITTDLPNGGEDVRWIMATSSLAAAVGGGWMPDFVIPGPLYLPTSGGMICWGKPFSATNPNSYVDCLAYGNYTGPSNNWIGSTPNPVTPEGHSLVRFSDMRNSLAFGCADTATPTNNSIPQMPQSLPATDPCPPTPTPTVTPTITPSPTPTSPSNDAVVLPPKPLKVKIPEAVAPPPLIKNVKVAVRNGNASGGPVPIKLTVSGCGGIAGTPDFDADDPMVGDTIALEPGKSKKAVVPLTITAAAFTEFNDKSPARCTVTFTAAADVPSNVDPAPSNDVANMEVNVLDLNDTNMQAVPPNHESVAVSLKPVKTKIKDTVASVTKTIKLKVTNADDEDPGHTITVTLGAGTCVGVGLPDFDPDNIGIQNSATVDGEKTATGVVTLSINSADFTNTTSKSPARCRQQFCQAGPMGNVEPNTSNDCTELVIDVTDANDF